MGDITKLSTQQETIHEKYLNNEECEFMILLVQDNYHNVCIEKTLSEEERKTAFKNATDAKVTAFKTLLDASACPSCSDHDDDCETCLATPEINCQFYHLNNQTKCNDDNEARPANATQVTQHDGACPKPTT